MVLGFPWADVKTVCDVGSGVGAFALPLSKAFPHISISLFDLPEPINMAQDVSVPNLASLSF